jgi:RNA polymerase sigma-70 factor (sigma-E family)
MTSMRDRRTDESFAAFVSAGSARLIAHAELLCGDRERARDIVQTVLTRAYPHWRKIERDDPYAYLYRAVTNAVTDWWRKAHRRHEQSVDAVPESADRGDLAGVLETRRLLLDAMRTLTLRERSVVVLRYLHDRTEQDTARVLGISTGTVKSTCHRALRKLRCAIDAEPTRAGAAVTPIGRVS